MGFIQIDFSQGKAVTENDFDWWLSLGRPDFALKDTGGFLSIGQAASLLSLTNQEVEERFYERSILVWEDVDLYNSTFWIPAFQFHGSYHLAGFHEILDILSTKLRVERISQFFVYEKPIPGIDMTAVELLKGGLTAQGMADLSMRAVAFAARYEATDPLDVQIWHAPKWGRKNKTRY